MTSLFVRGSFVIKYLEPAAASMGIELIHPPTDDTEADVVNSKEDCMGYLYFPVWASPPSQATLAKIKVPKIWWNLEDPNHFSKFIHQAQDADLIFTSASECINDYQSLYPGKPVHVLTWACEPTLHYPNKYDKNFLHREFDIVFVGNRYPGEMDRVIGEQVVLFPALEWADRNNKNIGVFGLGDDSAHSWKGIPAVWDGPYQKYTNAFEAGKIYRKSTVVLCMNEQLESPTMCSMRTYEACACGNIVLSHYSAATANIFGDLVNIASTPTDTLRFLDYLFLSEAHIPIREIVRANRAQVHVYEHHTYSHRLQELLNKIYDYFG